MTAPQATPRPSAASAAPATRRPLHRTWGERLLLVVGSIATVVCVLAASVLAWGLEAFGDISTVSIASVNQAPPGEPANWLLVGTDSREGIESSDPNAGVFIGGDPSELPAGKRTDTMIVARVDPETTTIDLLSIPRDLYVPIAGTGREGRINGAFTGEGGEARLVDTIESYLGIEINHYAEVNFVGFQAVVDELGGVPMWFDKPMRDSATGLNVQNAGCRVLDGFEALAFARSRKLEYFEDGAWRADPTGDLGRTSRQQYFLRRVVDTAAAQVDLTSLGKVNSLLSVGGSNLVIDESIEPGDLLGLAQTFSDAGGDRIVGHSLPVENFRTADGAAVLSLQLAAAQPTLDIFRGLATSLPPAGEGEAATTTTAPPQLDPVTVLNGSGVSGQAAEIAEGLTAAGLEVAEVGNAQARADTIVRYPSSAAATANFLIARLADDPSVEVDDSLPGVVLTTGTDFAGLAGEARSVEAAEGTTTTTAPPAAAGSDAAATPTTAAPGVVPEATPEGTACG